MDDSLFPTKTSKQRTRKPKGSSSLASSQPNQHCPSDLCVCVCAEEVQWSERRNPQANKTAWLTSRLASSHTCTSVRRTISDERSGMHLCSWNGTINTCWIPILERVGRDTFFQIVLQRMVKVRQRAAHLFPPFIHSFIHRSLWTDCAKIFWIWID